MTRPTDADLTLYALDMLEPTERMTIDVALASDETLRGELDRLRATLATLGSAAPGVAPSASLRDRVLGIADPRTRLHGFADRLAKFFDVPRAYALELVAAFDGQDGWETGPIPGTRVFHLEGGAAVAGADAGLVTFEAGMRFPQHAHKGEERMFIVSGEYTDDDGHTYREGDVIVSTPSDKHGFKVSAREPLLIAIALWTGIEIVGS